VIQGGAAGLVDPDRPATMRGKARDGASIFDKA